MTGFDDAPVWVNWIARDADGACWGYSVEPLVGDRAWYENEVGRCVRLGENPPDPGWRQALWRRPVED